METWYKIENITFENIIDIPSETEKVCFILSGHKILIPHESFNNQHHSNKIRQDMTMECKKILKKDRN